MRYTNGANSFLAIKKQSKTKITTNITFREPFNSCCQACGRQCSCLWTGHPAYRGRVLPQVPQVLVTVLGSEPTLSDSRGQEAFGGVPSAFLNLSSHLCEPQMMTWFLGLLGVMMVGVIWSFWCSGCWLWITNLQVAPGSTPPAAEESFSSPGASQASCCPKP